MLDRNGDISFAKVGLVIFVLVIALAGCTWALNWALTPFRILSVEHVEKEWTFAYTDIKALEQTAQMVCDAEDAVTNAINDNERVQRNTQLIALKNNYNRVKAEYDKELANRFAAGIVAPADVPRVAPTLDEMKQRVCGR